MARFACGSDAHLVAASFLNLFAVVGLGLYGPAYHADHFLRATGWTRADFMLGDFLAKLLVGPLLGFAAGLVIERRGPRGPLIAGLLATALALAGLASARELPRFYACFGLLAVGYLLAGPLPNQVLLARHFRQRRGRAMGVAYLGIGAGTLALPWLAHALAAGLGGWRAGLAALGALVAIVALPLVLVLPDPPAIAGAPARAPRLGPVLGRADFYLLVVGSMCSIGAVQGAYKHLKLLLALDQGRSQAETAVLFSILAAVSLLGRIGAGALADRVGPRQVMLLVYLLVAAATGLLAFAPAGPVVYPAVILLGLGLGGEYLVIPLMAAELFGTAVLARVMGIVLAADGVAEAVLPWIVGWLRDRSASYAASFRLLTVVALVGTIAVTRLPRRAQAAHQPRA